MIPPVFSAGGILPSMALDFTTASLDPRVSFTRPLNTATRVNSSGLVEIVDANLPRFDFDPVTLACRGLLIEQPSTNISYSQDMSNAVYTNAFASISTDVAVSPDGTTNADKIVEDTTAGQVHALTRSLGLTSGTYTFSIFAKAAERSWIRLMLNTSAGGNGSAYFNLSNGTIGTIGGGTATITNFGNGWYRCSVSGTITVSNILGIRMATGDGGQSYTGDGTSGVFVWGAQFESGAFPTSYTPTTTTSLTRNADVVSMTGTNFSSWWQATTGGLLVRARQLSIAGTRPWAYINDGTANNIISLRGNAADPELYIKATTDQVQIDAGTLTANASYGLSGAWDTNNCAAAFNGGAAGTDTSATIPTVDRMLIGSDGTNYLNGWVEKIAFWPQRIINAEVQAFSK